MKINDYFEQLRHDENHHLGLGDIRLTVGMQEDIIEQLSNISQERYNKAIEHMKKNHKWTAFQIIQIASGYIPG
jgi:hypothetical protein